MTPKLSKILRLWVAATMFLGLLLAGWQGQVAAADVDFTPSSHNFGNHDVGTNSAPQTFTLTNNSNGAGALTLDTFVLGGTNPGDFTIVNTTCGSGLALEASCMVNVRFNPTTAGVRTATVSNSTSASTYTATLSGTGIAAAPPVVQTTAATYAWGDGFGGKLGYDVFTSNPVPAQVLGIGRVGNLAGLVAISADDSHSLGLRADGTVVAWGNDAGGGNPLGIGNATQPAVVLGVGGVGTLNDIVAVANGQFHSLALKSDGTLYSWGSNQQGELGNDTVYPRSTTPVQVLGVGGVGVLDNVVAIAAGQFCSFAVRGDGTVVAWGRNNGGNLGVGLVGGASVPKRVLGVGGVGFLSGIVAISSGELHTLALAADGTVYAFGFNFFGVLGNEQAERENYTPIVVREVGNTGPLTHIVAVEAGQYHSLALKDDGSVLAWGRASNGALGIGPGAVDQFVPVHVANPSGTGPLTGVTALAAGASYTLALQSDGHLLAWGRNDVGQLGTNGGGDRNLPTPVAGVGGSGTLGNVVAIAAGIAHSLALTVVPTALAVAPTNGQVGGNASLSATLTRGDTGAPLAGRTVSFTLNGTAAGSATTNASGVATLVAPLGSIGAGAYPAGVQADFAATGGYLASTGTAALTVTQAPSLTFTPSPLAFGTQVVGTASAPQTLTVANSGNTPVTINGISIGSATEFAVAIGACDGATLFPGANCPITVQFTPSAGGARSDSITFTHNGSGSPQTVQLTGTGVAPPLTVTPGSRNFGAHNLGDAGVSQSFTVKNTGEAAVTLGGLTIVADGDRPTLLVSPESQDFGTQAAGTTSAPQQVTLINGGGEALRIASIALGGPNASDFLLVGEACAGGYLEPGESCGLAVVYWPQSASASTATIVVTTDDGVQHNVPLAGNGGTLAPVVPWGAGAARDYVLGANTCATATLQPLGECTFVVAFAPTLPGARNATVQIASNASASPTLVPLSGSGNGSTAGPRLGLTPSALDFGDQTVGTSSAQQQISVTNSGSATLTVSGLTLGGPNPSNFSIVTETCTAAPLSPGGSCGITVTFSPTATGPRHALIYLADDAPGDTRVLLSGAGSAPAQPVLNLPASYNFAPLAVGGQQGVAFTVRPGSAVPLTIGTVTVSGTDFSLNFNNCTATLSGTDICGFQIDFTPTSLGPKSGTVTVTSDAAGSPHVIALTGTGVAPPAPAVGLSPSSLAFGDQQVGTLSAAQTVTVTNTGTAALTIGTATISIGAADFAIVDTTCAAPLAPAATCTIQVRFNPATAGARTGTLSIPSNASGSPDTVALGGNGTAPAIALSPNGWSFGTVATGTTSAPLMVTVANTGGGPLALGTVALGGAQPGQFTLGATTCTATPLAVGASCTIFVTFAPAALGAANANLVVPSDAATSPDSVALSGTGTAPPAPVVAIAPSGTINFGAALVATQSAPQTITVSNVGDAALHVGTPTLSGNTSDFALVGNTCTTALAPNESCTIQVRFNPATLGAKAASLTIPSDAASSPNTVALGGTGVAPAVALSPASLSFGTQVTGTTGAAQSVTLTNTGTAPLTIASIVATGDFARTTTCPATLVAGATCTIGVSFTPTALGARSGSLTVTSDASGSPHAVALSGTGTAPTAPGLGLTPGSLAFGNQTVGTQSAAQTLTLTNTGTAPLVLGSLALTGANANQFALANDTCSGATVPAAQSCTVAVRFAPTTAGAKSAAVSVPSNAAGSPASVALSGTGSAVAVATTLTVAPATASYGGPATLSATLRDNTSAPLAGKSVAFTLGGAAVGSAVTNGGGVATLAGVSIGTRAVGGYANLVGARFTGDGGALVSSGTAALTVTRATLTVTATSLTRGYGVGNPALTVAYSGFANGDTATVLTGRVTIATTATAASNVGSYPITVVQNTLGAANYAFVFVNGTLAVTPAPLTITAVDKTRVYGAANPALTLKYTGFKQGDGAGDLGGTPSLSTAAASASPAGVYPITVGQGTLGVGNYAYTFVNGTLTVTAANTTVSAVSGAATYGGTTTLTATLKRAGGTPIAGATLAFTLNNAPVGNATTDASGVATLAGVALGGRGAGNYTGLIEATFAGDASQNGDSTTGTLRVAKAALVLKAVDLTRRVGQANPPCQVQLAPGASFANGDTLAALDLSNLSCTYGGAKANSPAGTYVLTPRGVTSANYAITYQNGVLTVMP